jgi:Mn-dependent DtxR family transcriptional regulator
MAGEKTALDAEAKKVLKAMKTAGGPAAPKQIAEAAGLDGKKVSDIIKGLKGQGLVESPVRCKWAITEAGKSQV